MVVRNIHITGKVQGVGFRASARREASRLGITGFVRNEPGGSVFIHAQGGNEAMEEFISWCDTGPAGAMVRELIVREAEPASYDSFTIAH